MRALMALLISGFAVSASVPGASAELPDPTRPYLYDVAPPITPQGKGKEEWRLSGVQIRPHSKSAILNGKLVQVGDRIGAASVVNIEPWQVTLTEEYRHVIVKLLSADVKVKVGSNDKHQ